MDSDEVTTHFVPNDFVGKIIGARGKRVNELQRRTGSQIKVRGDAEDKTDEGTPIDITGDADQVAKTIEYIEQIVDGSYVPEDQGYERYDRDGGRGGGGRRGDLTCYNCNAKGHFSRDCDKERGPRSPQICYSCNKEGHISRDCPDKSSGGGGGGGQGSRSPQICYNCNQEGHISRDCPDKSSGGGGGGGQGQRSPQICYSCNKEGHISRDCPDKSSGGGGGGQGIG